MIYICIPTHNEQQTVGVVLWKLRQVLTEFHRDYQLLVADDASTDKTTDVLEPYTRVLPLTVIRSERRQGYAASLEMLLREAVRRSEYPKRDVIVTLQADFSEEPDDVVGLIKRLEAGADLAVGIKVANHKEARSRRFARSLSHFFARKQKWPEGVVTPFDGYRAYRLHAVKRAMEERGGERLLRYDGWAGHAELLRAVLPHARRIDTLNVEDRPDRLQRPRRERPFAAAWQVRAMANGAQPAGLAGVDELDRIAESGSRTREASARAASAQPRTNGTRERRRPAQGTRATREARPERGSPTRSTGDRTRAARPERARTERAAGTTDRGAARAGSTSDERSPPPRPAAHAVAAEARAPDDARPDGSNGVTPATSAPKKRRRRRRGRGTAGSDAAAQAPDTTGATAATETEPGSDGSAGPPLAATGQPAAEADVAPEGGESGPDGTGGQPRRRRRGGRRGGRGRRRGPRADAADSASSGDTSDPADSAGSADSADPAGAAQSNAERSGPAGDAAAERFRADGIQE